MNFNVSFLQLSQYDECSIRTSKCQVQSSSNFIISSVFTVQSNTTTSRSIELIIHWQKQGERVSPISMESSINIEICQQTMSIV